ncbi:RiPP maturation radical SAM C-methyltransferase [Micromonospora psammae]|uniref:RiPP maturation radical SAM C-methyltransferase n=1 Tax=Micromonospora sp. CPCC 205556 TaxID=3122398 RepID=UPI002FF2ED04
MRITLVNMPWQALTWPSMAMSALDTVVTDLGHEVTQLYENLNYAEHCLDAAAGLSPADYLAISSGGFDYGVGEWVFTSTLFEPGWRQPEFTAYLERVGYQDIGPAIALHHRAPEFVDQVVERVLATGPDLVGLTTTFEQNVPSLAVALRLKQRRPDLPIALGGANCDGDMGAALHRNFPQINFVVRGEGERPLTELLEAMADKRGFESVTSLCWRDAHGRSVENPYKPVGTPGPALPIATIRPYFDHVHRSPARPWISETFLRLETSRGCWWGEKRQCTFCGLNGGSISYRSKPPERAWKEISEAVTEFGILDVTMTDNILDPAYLRTLLPQLAEAGWDLRIFYEVKSNLKPDELAVLAAAGVVSVQPGIESLASGPLSLMDKGTTGAAQVRALRLFLEHGIFPLWNYLYGFPGEDWERDYAHVVDQIPALVHLPPPKRSNRLSLDRFSPLFLRPELGIDERRTPAEWYGIVYPLSESELADIAYAFAYTPRGIDDLTAKRLSDVIAHWQRAYERSALNYRLDADEVLIEDRREGWPIRDHVLRGDEAAIYLTLARHLALPAVQAALRAGGYDIDSKTVKDLLHRWRTLGLVYEDDGVWVALAVPANVRERMSWKEEGEIVAA